jgi:hypothetical protein
MEVGANEEHRKAAIRSRSKRISTDRIDPVVPPRGARTSEMTKLAATV